jgi:hypothetical protein
MKDIKVNDPIESAETKSTRSARVYRANGEKIFWRITRLNE